jgi:WD40 repeat protein
MGHKDAVTSVAFSSDGLTLATVSECETLRLWDLDELNIIRGDPLRRACTLAGGSFNRGEWDRHASRFPHQDTCALDDRMPLKRCRSTWHLAWNSLRGCATPRGSGAGTSGSVVRLQRPLRNEGHFRRVGKALC